VSTTWTAARRDLYDRVPGLGMNFTAGYAGGYVTTTDHRFVQAGSLAALERYRGGFLFRPDRAAGDQIRPISDISYGSGTLTITHDGPAWSNQTDTNVEVVALDPDLLLKIYNRGLRLLKNPNLIPLAHGPADWDLQASADADWDDTNATFAKQTTVSEVFGSAKRSGSLTLSADGGYTQSAALTNMGRSTAGKLFGIAKADSGTGIGRVVDASGSTLSSVSFSDEEWAYFGKRFDLGSAQKQVRYQLLGTSNGDQIDAQHLWFVKLGDPTFYLPSWLHENATVLGVYRGHYDLPLADADCYLAGAVEVEKLIEGTVYRHYTYPGSAHPHIIRFEKEFMHLLEEPLFVGIEQPWSAPFGGVSAVFSTEASETDCPLDLLQAQVQILLYEEDPERFADRASIALPERAVWAQRFQNPEPEKDTGWDSVFPSAR